MSEMQGGYDYINKRVALEVDGVRHSIPVTVTGTKHASLSRRDMLAKGLDQAAIDMCVYIVKKHRNNNGKTFIVTLVD